MGVFLYSLEPILIMGSLCFMFEEETEMMMIRNRYGLMVVVIEMG